MRTRSPTPAKLLVAAARTPNLRFAEGIRFFELGCARDLEGIVGKYAGVSQTDNAVTSWLKVRNPWYTQTERRAELFELRRTTTATKVLLQCSCSASHGLIPGPPVEAEIRNGRRNRVERGLVSAAHSPAADGKDSAQVVGVRENAVHQGDFIMATTQKTLSSKHPKDLPARKEVKGGSDPIFIFEYSRIYAESTGRRVHR